MGGLVEESGAHQQVLRRQVLSKITRTKRTEEERGLDRGGVRAQVVQLIVAEKVYK